MGKMPLLCSPHYPGTRLNNVVAKNESFYLPPQRSGILGERAYG
jgi:hypothetical protein